MLYFSTQPNNIFLPKMRVILYNLFVSALMFEYPLEGHKIPLTLSFSHKGYMGFIFCTNLGLYEKETIKLFSLSFRILIFKFIILLYISHWLKIKQKFASLCRRQAVAGGLHWTPQLVEDPSFPSKLGTPQSNIHNS